MSSPNLAASPAPREAQSRASTPSLLPHSNEDDTIQPNPYTLSPGRRKCPIPLCPHARKVFNPQWRLTEHMKRHHGWPRKYKKPPAASGARDAEFSLLTPPNSHDPSTTSNDANLDDDPYARPYSTRGAAHRRSARVELRHDHVIYDDNFDRNAEVLKESPPDPLYSHGDTDLSLVEQIETCITELRTHHEEKISSPSPSPDQKPNPSAHYDDLAAGLSNALDRSLIKVNFILPPNEAHMDLLIPLYHALAGHAQSKVAQQKLSWPFNHVSDFLPNALPRLAAIQTPLPSKHAKTNSLEPSTPVDVGSPTPIQSSPPTTETVELVKPAKQTIKLKLNLSST